MKDSRKCDGRRFRAKIDEVECEGKVRVEDGRVYLCQNEKAGAVCRNKLGYKYSWDVTIDGKAYFEFPTIGVTDFRLIDMTAAEIEAYKDWQVGNQIRLDSYTWEVIFRSGKLVVCEREDGSASCNYTCNELHDKGFRLVADPVEEDAPVELTMDEIAEKFGIKAEKLRIKKKDE